MLYYLNDGYKGGETAFPLADNVTLDLSVSQTYCSSISIRLSKLSGQTSLIEKHTKWLKSLDQFDWNIGIR